jgi:hypothetical protein
MARIRRAAPVFHGGRVGSELTVSVEIAFLYRAQLLRGPQKAGATVTTVIIFHEVDDVGHWLGSPRREEVFGPMGIAVRTFVDPEKTNRVGLIVEIPDMAAFQQVMESEVVADAMRFDGVRRETVVMLAESLQDDS